jgi:hypothetical protein
MTGTWVLRLTGLWYWYDYTTFKRSTRPLTLSGEQVYLWDKRNRRIHPYHARIMFIMAKRMNNIQLADYERIKSIDEAGLPNESDYIV